MGHQTWRCQPPEVSPLQCESAVPHIFTRSLQLWAGYRVRGVVTPGNHAHTSSQPRTEFYLVRRRVPRVAPSVSKGKRRPTIADGRRDRHTAPFGHGYVALRRQVHAAEGATAWRGAWRPRHHDLSSVAHTAPFPAKKWIPRIISSSSLLRLRNLRNPPDGRAY